MKQWSGKYVADFFLNSLTMPFKLQKRRIERILFEEIVSYFNVLTGFPAASSTFSVDGLECECVW